MSKKWKKFKIENARGELVCSFRAKKIKKFKDLEGKAEGADIIRPIGFQIPVVPQHACTCPT